MYKRLPLLVLILLGQQVLLSQIRLDKPASGSKDIETTIALWAEFEASSAYTYQLNVSTDSTFASIDFEGTNNRYYVIATGLELGKKHFWRMRRWKGTDTTAWSTVWHFTTSSLPTIQGPRDGSALEEYTPIYLHRTHHYNYEIQLDTQSNFKSPALFTSYDIDTGKTVDLQYFHDGFYYNQKHYLRFRSFDSGDTSSWSATHAFDIEFELENAIVSNVEQAVPGFNWKRPFVTKTGAYEARIDTTPNFNSINLIQKSFTDLNRNIPLNMGAVNYNTQYYWSVRAMNTKDTSDWIQAASPFTTGDHTFSWSVPSRFYPNQDLIIRLDTFTKKARVYYDTTFTQFKSPNLKVFEFEPTYLSGDDTQDTLRLRNLFYGKPCYLTVQLFNGADSINSRFNFGRSVYTYSRMRDPYSFRKYGTRVQLNFDTSYAMGNYFRVQVDSNSDFSAPFVDSTYTSSEGFKGKRPIAELEFSKRYYWRVQNAHALDTSLWSNRYVLNSFETFTAPQLTSPSNNIQLNTLAFLLRWERVYNQWSANNDTVYYHLQYDTSANFNSTELRNQYKYDDNETSDSAFCKFFNTKYYWRVRIFNTMDTSEWSEVRSFITADQIFRIEPEDGDTNIMPSFVDWLSIDGTKGYILYFDSLQDLSSANNKWVVERNRPFFHSFFENNTSLDFSTQYFFKLGLFTDKDTLYSDTISFTTRKRNGVILTSPATGASNVSWNVNLRWNTFPGSSTKQYRIEVSENANMQDSQVFTSTGISRLVSLTPSKTYYWRVRAMFNDVTPTSDYSVIWSFNTKDGLDAPTLTLPEDSAILNTDQYFFRWSSVADATAYQLQVGFDPSFSGFRSFNPSSNGQTVDLLSDGLTYYWRVRAVSGGVGSPWSEVRSFEVRLNTGTPNLENLGLNIYPNPTTGKLIIDSKMGTIQEAEIMDSYGKLISHHKFSSGNTQTLNLHHLSDGIYQLIITREGQKVPVQIQIIH